MVALRIGVEPRPTAESRLGSCAVTREIALLTNPTSGKGKGARSPGARSPCRGSAPRASSVRDLDGRDADEALDLARQRVADGVEALVVCGGDGMVHLGVQAVAGTGHPLGVIPAGTGNDVARYFDIPRKDPLAAADRVIAGRRRARSTWPAAGDSTSSPCSPPGSTPSSTSAPTG